MIPSVYPFLEVDHLFCTRFVAWTNEYKNSRIVYILLGHDKYACPNEFFRSLVENAVRWVGV
jgi:type 1 glutamine amidotransferase